MDNQPEKVSEQDWTRWQAAQQALGMARHEMQLAQERAELLKELLFLRYTLTEKDVVDVDGTIKRAG